MKPISTLLFLLSFLAGCGCAIAQTQDSLPKADSLSAVTVIGRKPLVEVKPDKLVFNVENSINAIGGNGLEVLRKAPGVVVDKDENILLSGKSGIRIYIDGRPSPLAGTDLTDYLKSLPAGDIATIEIITNPSARFEAAGSAGIINIRLKSSRGFGWNGNLNSSYAIGQFAKYNAGSSFNYRNRKLNFFGNISLAESNNASTLNLYRLQNDSIYDQRSQTIFKNNSQNARAGLDITLSRFATAGMVINTNFSAGEGFVNSVTPILPQSSKELARILTARGRTSSRRATITTNMNYRFADTSGHVFSIDLDYGGYRLKSSNLVPNQYVDATGNFLSDYTFSTISPTDIDLFGLKADYETGWLGGKLATGFKSSLVKTRNDFGFFNKAGADFIKDIDRSNQFTYMEQIHAAYLLYNRQKGKWNLESGLRVEWTISDGQLKAAQTQQDESVRRNYLDWFPSAGLTYQLNPKNSLGLSFSRRIDRPNYRDLNPFESQIDELTYQKGNPFLNPQYTTSYELRHTYQYKLVTTLGYSTVRDFFAQITDTIEGRRNFIQQRNIASQKIWSLNISYPFQLAKWWSVYANLNGYHTRYKADFEPGKAIRLQATGFTLYQQHSFNLGKNWMGEISSFFSTPYVWAGTYETEALGGIDLGLQKKLFKERATIKASISDILRTYPWRGVSRLGELTIYGSGGWESRQFRLAFTWKWGKKEVKAARNRNTGLEGLEGRVD
ncbi:outer membrane beta-barrel family protein [Flavihumibacter cheonanensis]|uniref:outer membrane beta-barrel family protein n=1 Tax=Flavihumibacter cheonanensis TaxID=1442385 RepID=UPI001EF82724|nr:outer membrane beta-barrel family protein [Flavihumibacter cheonanensis]MCG7752800.1 TonB-dependent receptor [Flavihumibacter cheonanensis]